MVRAYCGGSLESLTCRRKSVRCYWFAPAHALDSRCKGRAFARRGRPADGRDSRPRRAAEGERCVLSLSRVSRTAVSDVVTKQPDSPSRPVARVRQHSLSQAGHPGRRAKLRLAQIQDLTNQVREITPVTAGLEQILRVRMELEVSGARTDVIEKLNSMVASIAAGLMRS
jgi:hypothetical protein